MATIFGLSDLVFNKTVNMLAFVLKSNRMVYKLKLRTLV